LDAGSVPGTSGNNETQDLPSCDDNDWEWDVESPYDLPVQVQMSYEDHTNNVNNSGASNIKLEQFGKLRFMYLWYFD